MTDALTTEAIYLRLGGLIADAPDLKTAPTLETHRWIAQVLALIEAGKLVESVDIITFKWATRGLEGALHDTNARRILAIAHQALAKAELHARCRGRSSL